jgi:hypothetical protein
LAVIGVHALVYARKAAAARRFLRDVLALSWVDAGDGWLIFAAPPTEIAVHPTRGKARQELYLMCLDIRATVAELRARGVRVSRRVVDQGWGLVTAVHVPGTGDLGLYEPKHPLAHRARLARKRATGSRRSPRTRN